MSGSGRPPRPTDAERGAAREAPETFPVVGIGASAGSISVLSDFFGALPDRVGAAFVVVVHLDPGHPSELAAILARRTSMPVSQVTGSARLLPDHIYVIPPNLSLRISDREVSTFAFEEPRGQRAPIDAFFRSMADQHGDGFAVILTGAGSDGAVGVKAIKEGGGIILVQDPNEAEYPSMPRAAIATGVVDFVLPVPQLASRLVELIASKRSLQVHFGRDGDEDHLRSILAYVRARTGQDFSRYKRATIVRRLARRMQVRRMERIKDYLDFLKANSEEAQALFADLLISVTTFFRDREAFDALARLALPHLFDENRWQDPIRIWVAGCATGEEAYSIAILVLEEIARRDVRPDVQIFASDLDAGALAVAREGRYPVAIEADLGEDRVRRFFTREGEFLRVKRELRDIILFANHSVLKDPPFSRLDLVSCRNLLIYLERDLQQQVISTFHYALKPGGFLFLGSAESADHPSGYFRPVDREARIYRAVEHAGERFLPLPRLGFSAAVPELTPPPAARRPSLHSETIGHRHALEESSPPSILIDDAYHIVHLSENAGRYLQHPGGQPTADVTELVRPELRLDLRVALHRALERRETVLTLPAPVRFNGAPHHVCLQVRPVQRSEDSRRYCLVFFIEGGALDFSGDDSAGTGGAVNIANEAMHQLREELQLTRSRLRASQEEYEAANEEFRAANEELQSINEEYRSTAEELETSKEELQSINEELQTLNAELKLKLESVSRAHSDLQNLMAATDVGTLFLSPDLRIKRLTPRIQELFNITPSDEGRPITDFSHHLRYDGIARDAETVLRDLVPVEREVQSTQGRWYLLRLRPYRTVDDRIDGVVATFVDVTARRETEQRLRESEDRLRIALAAARMSAWTYDADREEVFMATAGLWSNASDGERFPLDRLLENLHPEDRAAFADAVRRSVGTGEPLHVESRTVARDGAQRWMVTSGRATSGDGQRSIFAVSYDVSDRKALEERQRLLLRELSHRVKNTLAVVQAMARQSFRGSGSPQNLVERFEGRLQALSASHDLLFQGDWRGAEVGALARQQLAPYLSSTPPRVQLDGDPVELSADVATPFGLVIHELATNAAKHGALSVPDGSVQLSWKPVSERGQEYLGVTWKESGAPGSPAHALDGFGTFLIDHAIPGARVEREYTPDGLHCAMRFPLASRTAAASGGAT